MERRITPPAGRESSRQAPNSLEQPAHHAGRGERPHSSHAETKQGLKGGDDSKNSSRLPRTAQDVRSRLNIQRIDHAEAARRWVSDSVPISPGKRKRPVDHPLGLPSLTSPGTIIPPSRPIPRQHQPRDTQTKSNATTGPSEANDKPPSDNGSSDSDSFLNAQKTALHCVDHASRRKAAAEAALAATNQISSSLQDLVGDSNRAVTVARKSRIEAENAAVRAEGAARKVKEASDFASNDKQRASLELEEANAQAEEALEFLRRIKGTSLHREKDRDHKAKTDEDTAIPARIGTIVEVSEDGTDCSSFANNNPLSPRKKSGGQLSHAETKIQRGEQGEGPARPENPSPSHMKIPLRLGAPSSGRDALIEPIRKFRGHTSPVTQVAAIDNTRFLSSSWDATVRMWDANTGECLRTFCGHSDWVHAVSVLNNGRRFLSGSDDRTVKLWDVGTGECIHTYRGHTSFVKALAPMDGDRFLSGSRDRTVKLFSVTSGECLHTFEGHVDVVSSIVALDSNHFATGSHDNNIKYWDVSSATCVRTLVGHVGSIKTLAAISDREIISGSDDKRIRLWDVIAGKCLREFGSKNTLVFSVNYICEGFFLSCGGNNIKLYHIPSGECVKSYETPRISLAVVRLDDERFVTGSDQMLHLWKF